MMLLNSQMHALITHSVNIQDWELKVIYTHDLSLLKVSNALIFQFKAWRCMYIQVVCRTYVVYIYTCDLCHF